MWQGRAGVGRREQLGFRFNRKAHSGDAHPLLTREGELCVQGRLRLQGRAEALSPEQGTSGWWEGQPPVQETKQRRNAQSCGLIKGPYVIHKTLNGRESPATGGVWGNACRC